MTAVEFRNVFKYFGDTPSVNDLSLTINDGEFMVLVGPSGCGKTTSLRMLAGLEKPTHGDIVMNGARINDVRPGKRDVAMVFQSYALFPHASVYENLVFGARARGGKKRDFDATAREVARVMGLEPYLDRRPHALSGGQRQRVALGRALLRKPQLFLMDEPLSNLDAGLRVQMRAEITRLQRELGVTTVYVTHDQIEAMTMGHRIAVMNNGELQQVGTPEDLYANPGTAFVGRSIGSPHMSLVDASLEATADGAFVTALGSRFALPYRAEDVLSRGGPMTLGLRPVDVRSERMSDTDEHIDVLITAVEPMGSETFVIGEHDGQTVSARFDAELRPQIDARATVYFEPRKAYLFDATTGRTALNRRTRALAPT